MASQARIEIIAENHTQQAFKQTEASLRALEQQTRDVNQASRQTLQAFERTGRGANDLAGGFTRANRGAGILTTSLGGLGTALSALGIAAVTHEIGQFAVSSVQAAGRLELLHNALTQVQGSTEAADQRLRELDEIARLPGANLEALVRYDARLQAIGLTAQESNTVLRDTGQAIVSMGGTAVTATEALEQISQALEKNVIIMHDLRPIIQRVPGFLSAIADTHDVEPSLDGLREATERLGGSVKDSLLPVLETLAERFAAPPPDSYVRSIDELQNSFFLFQSSVGNLLLPAIIDASQALTIFFDSMREGLKDVTKLPPEIQHLVAGARDLYAGLQNIAASISSSIGPEIKELAAALATLLGSVLDLVGSISQLLAPAYELWNQVNAIVIAAVTKLAQDVNSIIGVITDFIDWIRSAWGEEEIFEERTNQVAAALENVEKATNGASVSVQDYQRDLTTLLTELASVNAELEQKKARLKELEAEGLTPTDASLQQIVRRIALLEESSKSLTGSLPDLKQELENVNKELADKQQRLEGMIEKGEDATGSAEHLSRSITTLTTLASLLNAQIALTPPALSETSKGMDTAKEAIENYSLTLARLKARAEDARETLSDTIDFQKLSANYRAAIAESDAYYNRQIANAEAALSKEKENTDEYRKIETDLFELRREKEQARKKLVEDASKVGETEAKRRIKVAEEENERLREAGEETARALEASQKAQAQATAAAQKELTRIHQENLKEREEADRAANQRIVKASEDQLKILANIFENGSTEGVNQAYQNIQRATIQHYETLKSQARQRITDEDALTAELVKLDRERNAALSENHRDYLQRIANDAKDLLGERTEAFQDSSADILHDWERAVSQFERQLREADTEAAIREIESDFESGQQNMLASLESVITELGFNAEQSAEIMKGLIRTAESETDNFADKVISAFKRLGKEIDRETKRQNRELEKSYRELINNIGDTIGQVGDLLGDGLGGTLESVFSGLVRTASGDLFGLVDIATSAISFIQAREEELHRRRQERARERQEFEDEQAIRVQNIQRVQQILPNAESNIRRPRPRDVDAELNRGVNARRRVRAELQDLQGITLSGVSSDVLSQLQSQQLAGQLAALTTNLEDIISRSDIEEIYQRFLNSFETAMDSAGLSFQTAIDRGLSDAEITAKSAEFLGAINDLYDLQIEQIRDIEAATGNILFDEIQAINNLRSERLNQARLLAAESTGPNLTTFGFQRSVQEARATAERTGTDRAYSESIAREQYGDEAYDAEVAAAEVDQEALASVIERINEDVGLINASITSIETQIEQASEPAEIAELLSQVPDLIREKYTRLREALQQRFDADEISQDVFDASLSELASSESRDLESHSDAVLANTIQAINEDVSLINASVMAIQTQIEQTSEPAEIAELLLKVPDLIREKYKQLRNALDARYAAGEISTDIYNASLSELASSETSDLERHSDAVLANTIRAINADVQLIDASITALQTQINQLSEPEAIAELLSQLPALIQEKYQTLRTALDTRYAAGEISLDVYNASLTELESRETAELESHSDQILANTLRAIDEDAELINASITALQSQIDQTSEPAEIASLLNQLPALITEKYRLLRNALDEKYAAGEISTDVYNASLSQLANSKSAETENQSDAVLANTLADIDDDVELIDANIGALEAAVEQSDDPETIAGLLDAIKILVMDKYNRLRDRLEELHTAEEISTDSYNAALTALGTAESRALAEIDTQALNAISEAAQEQVDFINGAIENLRLSIQLTDDPAEAQQILDAIKILTAQRFAVLRDELEKLKDTLDDDKYDQALKGINLAEQVALDNIDTEKFSEISAAAQEQVEFINGGIENLRLSLQLTDDPAETQQILDAIKILTANRFKILRDELNAIRESFDNDDQFDQALMGINLAEQLAIQNLDTEKFSAISVEAKKQVDLINGSIENLRLSLQLTDDPTDRQAILDAIKVLTAKRFDILIQELKDIRENFDNDEQFEQALTGLELGKTLALENIDTEKFSEISAEAQGQVDLINTDIENLRLSLQLTDEPAERQQILNTIRSLTKARFDVLRKELFAIRDSFDTDAEFNQALRGFNLAEQVAIKNLDTEKFSEVSAEAEKQVNLINGSIENLRLSLQLTDDPAKTQQILDAIKILTAKRFNILIQELKDIRESFDSNDEFEQALEGLEIGKQVALDNIDTEKFSQISAAAQSQVDFINGAIENLRLSFELTDDPAEQQQIIESIKILTRTRFAVLRKELMDIRENLKPQEFAQALEGLNLGERLALSQLDTERFGVISEAAQEQVDFINGAISNLELSLQLTDDPDEIQRVLASIRILTAKRFDVLIDELKALEDSFDNDAEFNQALEGLQLGKQVALKGIADRSIGVTLTGIGEQISAIDFEINQFFGELETETTAAGVRESMTRLRSAIEKKYELLREKINESAETEEEKARQIAGVNFQENQALDQLGQRGLGQFNNLLDTAQFLLDNATEAEFAQRRENLITAINTFYDERIRFIESQDLSDIDRANMLAVAEIQRDIALNAVPQMHESVIERLELERELQEQIQDLRDDAVETESDRLEKIADLHQRHNEKILELEEKLQDDILGLRRDRSENAADIEREFQRDLEDLRTRIARDLFEDDSIISFGDLTDAQRQQVEASTDFQRRLFDLERDRDRDRQDLNTEFGVLRRESTAAFDYHREALQRGELSESDILAAFGRRGLDQYTRFTQGSTDATEDLEQRIADTNTEAEATSEAISTALTPLLEKSETTATLESETALTTSETAVLAAETAITESETATKNASITEAQETLAILQETAAISQGEAARLLSETTTNLNLAVDAFAAIPAAFDDVVIGFRALPENLLKAIRPLLSPIPEQATPPPNQQQPLSSTAGNSQVGGLSPAPGQNGIGNRPAFANQPIVIQNVLQMPDGVLHQLNDSNAVLTADGRTLQ